MAYVQQGRRLGVNIGDNRHSQFKSERLGCIVSARMLADACDE